MTTLTATVIIAIIIMIFSCRIYNEINSVYRIHDINVAEDVRMCTDDLPRRVNMMCILTHYV